MAKSIMQREKVCWFSGAERNLHEHHIFGGARRKLSEKYGLKVYLRMDLHEKAHSDRETAMKLKRAGQRAFEKTHTREEFMQIFGKNYIYDDEPAERAQEFPKDCFKTFEGEELPYGL